MESNSDLDILKCKLNSDSSILTTVLEKEIKFFETKTFKEIEGLTDKTIGLSKVAFPIHRSNILIILGTKTNPNFKENSVYLWDIENQETIGSINIKEDPFQPDDILFDVFLANTYLFLVSKYRIYMFDLMTLEHEFTFEDVWGIEGAISYSYSKRKIVFAYISNTNHSIVKINKIKITEDKLEYSQRFLSTDFDSIQYIKISPQYGYLAVADTNGEKINVYSLRSYKVKKFLWSGQSQVKIISIFFDSDNNYLGIFSSQKTLHIYSISELNFRKRGSLQGRKSNKNSLTGNKNEINNELNNTLENDEDEEQLNAIKSRKKNKTFKSIKKKVGNKYADSFARYKDDQLLCRDVVFIFFNDNYDVVIIDKIGKVFVIKFNKKSGGECWLIENKKLDCGN